VVNRLLQPVATGSSTDELIKYRERLGGMLNYYLSRGCLKVLVPFLAPNGGKRAGEPLAGVGSGAVTPLRGDRRFGAAAARG